MISSIFQSCTNNKSQCNGEWAILGVVCLGEEKDRDARAQDKETMILYNTRRLHILRKVGYRWKKSTHTGKLVIDRGPPANWLLSWVLEWFCWFVCFSPRFQTIQFMFRMPKNAQHFICLNTHTHTLTYSIYNLNWRFESTLQATK